MRKQESWSWMKEYIKDNRLPSYEGMIKLILDIDDKNLRALMAVAYLTGARATEYLSLKREDIEVEERGGRHLLVFSLKNNKNPRTKEKKATIPYDDKEEVRLLIPVLDYVDKIPKGQLLFDLNLRQANRYFNHIFKSALGKKLSSHYIRHIRLTHLVRYKHFDAFRLQLWAGWSSMVVADNYMKLDYESFWE